MKKKIIIIIIRNKIICCVTDFRMLRGAEKRVVKMYDRSSMMRRDHRWSTPNNFGGRRGSLFFFPRSSRLDLFRNVLDSPRRKRQQRFQPGKMEVAGSTRNIVSSLLAVALIIGGVTAWPQDPVPRLHIKHRKYYNSTMLKTFAKKFSPGKFLIKNHGANWLAFSKKNIRGIFERKWKITQKYVVEESGMAFSS